MVSVPESWRTVWITGASSGIGRAFCQLIADDVAHVAASARSADKLRDLQRRNPAIDPFPVDVTDGKAVADCVARIEKECGDIDLAVLCAGTWTLMDVANFDPVAIRRGVDVNYMGVVHAVAALLPGMMARRSGHIAIVASVSGYRGLPRAAAYGPTKAALINLAETLRAELEPHGITISIVNPGFVETPMTADNPFPMPGIISAETAAERLLAGLARRQYEIVFPKRFGYAVKALRFLPNGLFFWLIRRFVLKSKTTESAP